MSTALAALEALLPEMTPGEKVQLLQWVISDLGGTFPGIEKTPSVCGGMQEYRERVFLFGCSCVSVS